MSRDFVGARFAFTKLVVNDLELAAPFYRSVCEYDEGQRVKADFAGRSIEEIIFRKPGGDMELALMAYLDGPPSSPGSVITAFDTADLDGFQSRLLAAGGAVFEAIRAIEFGGNRMRLAFYTDIDGYLLEVIER